MNPIHKAILLILIFITGVCLSYGFLLTVEFYGIMWGLLFVLGYTCLFVFGIHLGFSFSKTDEPEEDEE